MKKTGKALSLVLSLALVVSSLTATFASAATSEGSTVTLTQDTVYLANGGSGDTLKANVYSELSGVKSMVSSSGQTIANATLKDAAITSGSALASLTKDIDNSKVEIDLTSPDKTGTVKIAARYEGSYNKEDGTTVNVNGQTTLTATILKGGSLVIGKSETTAPGKKPSDLDTLSRSVGDSVDGAVYLVGVDTDDSNALATFTAQEVETDSSKLAKGETTWDTIGSCYLVNSSSSNLALTGSVGDKKITITAGTASQTKGDTVSAQTATVTATKYSKATGVAGVASPASADTVKTSAKVDNRVEVSKLGTGTAYNEITMDNSGRTVLRDTADTKGKDVVLASGTIVDCDSLATMLTVVKGTVTTITNATATPTAIEIDKGAVTSITKSGTVLLKDGSVGSITDVAAGKAITINGGKVGTITPATHDSNGLPEDIAVTVNATVKNTTASAGAVTAKTVTVGSSDAVTTASSITKVISTSDDFSATIDGAYASVGTIDVNKKNASINYIDDYNDAAAAIINVNADKLPALSVASDANVTFKNDVTLGSVSDDGTVTFSGNTSIAGAIGSGSGTIVFVPGKFYTTADLSGVVMEVLGGKISAGMTLFTAAPYAVSASSFTPKGYTVAKVSGDKVDTFKVDKPDFYGIVLNKTTDKVAKGYSATYTASAYPTGTSLPDGATVKFTFDGSEDNFSFTDNGNGTATVKVLKYDDVFTDLNKATLTATLYDAYGVELYQYTPAKCAITAIAVPEVNFTCDSFPTTMKAGQQYTVKITSADGTAPKTVFADGFAVVNNTTVSGNATFVKFTAKTAGEHGVYVSGNKVAVINVKGSICDTTTVTKKAGQPYTFKVTSPTNAAPTFVIGGIGAIKPVKVSGHDYFYKYVATANKGVHGVYVNGAVIALYTFA